MHNNVITFIKGVKQTLPKHFTSARVLDCGSLDINGSNRRFFSKSKYTGIDIVSGKGVDILTEIHNFVPELSGIYDVVISTEMLEHDKYYADSLKAMFRLLKPNGLLIVTAAGEGRPEHGTTNTSPQDSPLTNDYYKNVTVEMIQQGLNFSDFSWFNLAYQEKIGDIQFAGVKK